MVLPIHWAARSFLKISIWVLPSIRILTYEAARVTAYETRASNCPWTYSPTVDMARDPRWPRVWENYGEDCLVNAIMGSTAVRGFQGDDPNHIPADRIATSVKHYMGYSMPRTGKDRTPAYISVSELREKCFALFKACVEAGALTIVVNSGSINGKPVHADRELLTQWLKEDLGWDGMLITTGRTSTIFIPANMWRQTKKKPSKWQSMQV